MDHGAMVDQAAASVLANHEILMASPAASKLNSFYPNPSESECTIAQAVCNSGQLFIQSNSKQIGGSCDFMVSTPNILDCPQLLMSFKMPGITDAAKSTISNQVRDVAKDAYWCTNHDGWGFDLIDRLEVSFANSNISNLQIQGHAMRDWSLLQCKNADERKQMLRIAGAGKTWSRDKDVTLSACIPISFLFMRSAGGVKGGFGIDGRVLNGPITFQFHFKQIRYAISPVVSVYDRGAMPSRYDQAEPYNDPNLTGNAQYPAWTRPSGSLPTSFSQLELTMRTYQLMDGTFSVSKALEANPSLIYSIPSLWMNTYSQTVDIDAVTGAGAININSVPAGMVQAIIVRARPVNATTFKQVTVTSSTDNSDADTKGDYNSKLNYEPPLDYNQVRNPIVTLATAPDGGTTELLKTQQAVTPVYRPYVPWSLPFKSLQLQYSGQSIYNAKTSESHDGFTRSIFQDDLKTSVCGMPLTLSGVGQIRDNNVLVANGIAKNINSVTLVNLGDDSMVDHETQTFVIPFMHDGNSIFRHRAFENLPHYSGSTLQLQFELEKTNRYRASGLNRVQCNKDGTQYKDSLDTLVSDKDAYENFTLNSGVWVSEGPASKCASYPSNRLQHVALTRPVTLDTVAGSSNGSTQIHERILFNNDPTSEGACAYTDTEKGKVQLDLTYVIASLFQVTNGVAELQL